MVDQLRCLSPPPTPLPPVALTKEVSCSLSLGFARMQNVRMNEASLSAHFPAYILNGIHDHSRSYRDHKDIRGHAHIAMSRWRRP